MENKKETNIKYKIKKERLAGHCFHPTQSGDPPSASPFPGPFPTTPHHTSPLTPSLSFPERDLLAKIGRSFIYLQKGAESTRWQQKVEGGPAIRRAPWNPHHDNRPRRGEARKEMCVN